MKPAHPDAWLDRVLARIHLEGEVARVRKEREDAHARLKRLGKAFVDGLYDDDAYWREKRLLEEKIAGLVVPGVDAARAAGEILEDLPRLWDKATLGERRLLLTTMLDAVYVELKEEKRVVAIRPKPAFRPLFEIATMREGCGIVLVVPDPTKTARDVEDSTSCFWWRRGGVEPPVQGSSRRSAPGSAG